MRVLQVMASNTDIHAAQHDCRSFLDQYKGCRAGRLPNHPLISCLKLFMLVRCPLSMSSLLQAPRFLRPVSADRGSVCTRLHLLMPVCCCMHATTIPSALPEPEPCSLAPAHSDLAGP